MPNHNNERIALLPSNNSRSRLQRVSNVVSAHMPGEEKLTPWPRFKSVFSRAKLLTAFIDSRFVSALGVIIHFGLNNDFKLKYTNALGGAEPAVVTLSVSTTAFFYYAVLNYKLSDPNRPSTLLGLPEMAMRIAKTFILDELRKDPAKKLAWLDKLKIKENYKVLLIAEDGNNADNNEAISVDMLFAVYNATFLVNVIKYLDSFRWATINAFSTTNEVQLDQVYFEQNAFDYLHGMGDPSAIGIWVIFSMAVVLGGYTFWLTKQHHEKPDPRELLNRILDEFKKFNLVESLPLPAGFKERFVSFFTSISDETRSLWSRLRSGVLWAEIKNKISQTLPGEEELAPWVRIKSVFSRLKLVSAFLDSRFVSALGVVVHYGLNNDFKVKYSNALGGAEPAVVTFGLSTTAFFYYALQNYRLSDPGIPATRLLYSQVVMQKTEECILDELGQAPEKREQWLTMLGISPQARQTLSSGGAIDNEHISELLYDVYNATFLFNVIKYLDCLRWAIINSFSLTNEVQLDQVFYNHDSFDYLLGFNDPTAIGIYVIFLAALLTGVYTFYVTKQRHERPEPIALTDRVLGAFREYNFIESAPSTPLVSEDIENLSRSSSTSGLGITYHVRRSQEEKRPEKSKRSKQKGHNQRYGTSGSESELTPQSYSRPGNSRNPYIG